MCGSVERQRSGGINLKLDKECQTGEFSYALATMYGSRGFMTEAVGTVINWAFEQEGLLKISSQADIRHLRSIRIMEKLGIRREEYTEAIARV